MKLYFMIGLPTEQDEDVVGIIHTGARARAVGRKLGTRGAKVTCSVSTHVPKPHTPFQWCAQDPEPEVLRKQAMLRFQARATGVSLKMHDSRGSWIEGVLARGDRTLGDVLEGAYRRGARFDSWDEQLALDAWKEAFAETGVEPARYLGTIPTSARLPWDHIDVGLERGFLEKEYRKAVRNRLSPPCGKAVGAFIHHTHLGAHTDDKKKLVCYDCGVACDMTAMRERRGEMLIKLGALGPRVKGVAEAPAPPALESVAVPDADAAAGEEPAAVPAEQKPKFHPSLRRKPPVRPSQGPPLRLRLQYEKLGRAAFSSHLDLVRVLPRLFRRLSLPLYYSLGFNPKPVMVFGPALSLGVLSLAEYVDLKLAADRTVDIERLPQLLSEACIDGVRFVAARELGPDDRKLGTLIDEAVYVAAVPRAALDAIGVADAIALQALIDERTQGALVVRRNIEGVGKRIDVGKYLLSARVGRGGDALADAGLRGELLPIELRMAFTPAGTAKALEAVEALLGSPELPVRCVRAAMLCTRNGVRVSPLELETLRSVLSVSPVTSEVAEAALS
jgi:radical SAM-linked protein